MKKLSEFIFKKGIYQDDSIYQIMTELNAFTHKPDPTNPEDVKLFEGIVDECSEDSYYTVVDKKFKLVLFVEDN